MKKIKYFFPSIVWQAIILVLIIVPGNYIPYVQTFADWLQWDKIVHLFLFGLLSMTLLWGFFKVKRLALPMYLFVFLFSALWGGVTEYLQYWLDVGRNGNIYDFSANLLGNGLGCFFFFLIKKEKTTIPSDSQQPKCR